MVLLAVPLQLNDVLSLLLQLLMKIVLMPLSVSPCVLVCSLLLLLLGGPPLAVPARDSAKRLSFICSPTPHPRALGPAGVFGFFHEYGRDPRQACCVFRPHERLCAPFLRPN